MQMSEQFLLTRLFFSLDCLFLVVHPSPRQQLLSTKFVHVKELAEELFIRQTFSLPNGLHLCDVIMVRKELRTGRPAADHVWRWIEKDIYGDPWEHTAGPFVWSWPIGKGWKEELPPMSHGEQAVIGRVKSSHGHIAKWCEKMLYVHKTKEHTHKTKERITDMFYVGISWKHHKPTQCRLSSIFVWQRSRNDLYYWSSGNFWYDKI